MRWRWQNEAQKLSLMILAMQAAFPRTRQPLWPKLKVRG
jgi:hypothetical protein